MIVQLFSTRRPSEFRQSSCFKWNVRVNGRSTPSGPEPEFTETLPDYVGHRATWRVVSLHVPYYPWRDSTSTIVLIIEDAAWIRQTWPLGTETLSTWS